jgi:integrase
MGKRGNSEGTITKRKDGRWEARISLPDGKRKSFYGESRQEVAKRLSEARHQVDRGFPLPGERLTVGQHLTNWIEGTRLYVKPSTRRRYQEYVLVHLIPGLGHIPLSKLTMQQVQAFYTHKLDAGMAGTTLHHLHTILRQALKQAVKLGLVPYNVTDQMKAPRRTDREMAPLTEDQAQQLRKVVAGDRFEALYTLALTTGMREGELLALRWQEVDLEQASLVVRMGLQRDGTHYSLAETKTARSRRRIGLSKTAVAALRAHWVHQQEERQALGPAWNAAFDLVFPNTIGEVMNANNFVIQHFKKALVKASLPNIRFHELRHTAATILLSHGVNVKVVSEMLGHADVSTTLRVYAHVIPHMQQAAADVMDALFGEAAKRGLSSKLSSNEKQ